MNKMYQKELDNFDEVYQTALRSKKIVYCMEHGHTFMYGTMTTDLPPRKSSYICSWCGSQVIT